MQWVIPLTRDGEPLYRQVYRGMRQAILGGAAGAGERLPSTRDLAEQLGISRTVVLLAYEQLLAEGFVIGRGGSGTYVSEGLAGNGSPGKRRLARLRLSRFGEAAMGSMATVNTPLPRPVAPRYNFIYGRSDLETFPFALWRRLLLRQARRGSTRQFDYGSALGNPELRAAICAHLRRARAVVCDPSEVMVVNGSQQALDLVMRVLVQPGDAVAIENPQYDGIREALRVAGARLRPVPVDRDGLDPARLPEDARMVFVTPSHQFPTGAILSLDRRLALLRWARRRNAVIVEDDYDGEFHYDGRPLESLQGLDREGRIIYIGTFSRTVFPALRIGYLIAPASLVPAFTAAKWLSDLHSATLEQQTLAEFIRGGMYERHLRRLRRRNTARRAALLEAIGKYLGDRVEVTGEGAGAQVVLWPRKRVSEEAIVAEAAKKGVGIYGIAHCYVRKPSRPGFLLGYARLTEREIREGIRLLGEVL
ncbi:MAG TPA: PLP-dependent aminotransferase family protein [Acidobacteriaceae bacterium]|nr:PLP-dependent aminotransferase family protein [Acidobacteriaceae bacterium]